MNVLVFIAVLVFTSKMEIIRTLKVTDIDFFTRKSSLLAYPMGEF